MAIINFNYTMAINQANQIENVANDMQATADKQLQNSMDAIGACWRGDTARLFIGHCAGVQGDIRSQVNKLRDLARRIREVAKVIQEAEDKVKELQRRQAEAAAKAKEVASSSGHTLTSVVKPVASVISQAVNPSPLGTGKPIGSVGSNVAANAKSVIDSVIKKK